MVFLQGNDVNSNVKSHDVAENVDGESMICEVSDADKHDIDYDDSM